MIDHSVEVCAADSNQPFAVTTVEEGGISSTVVPDTEEEFFSLKTYNRSTEGVYHCTTSCYR